MLMPVATTWKVCLTSRFHSFEDGSAIIWDTSMAGDPMTEGVLSGELTISEAGTGYNGGQTGTLD